MILKCTRTWKCSHVLGDLKNNSLTVYSSLQKFCYQNGNSKLISDKITTIFNDFLHWSGRTYQILPQSINEHNFLLFCVMFSFTHTFKTLVNILKNTVRVISFRTQHTCVKKINLLYVCMYVCDSGSQNMTP
jgi:hypothetical protein